jgi:hypothetical protein
MATNIAVKRARKAQRRKQILAERRREETFETSLAGRVRRAAGRPIQHCLLSGSLSEAGMATLILARGNTAYDMTLVGFLIDTFGRGVKDVMVRSIGADEFEIYVEAVKGTAPVTRLEPSHARKLLRDVVAYARSLGLAPHRDFAVAEQIFADVSADACDIDFRIGRDGPHLLAG